MFQLDLKSRKSIYEQVVDNIKSLVMAGVLKPEDKLPSVRELSRIITVNPNTVQKAYRELERQGYLYTVLGLGTFITEQSERKPDEDKLNDLKKQLRQLIQELRYNGMETAEIRCLILDLLNEKGQA